MDHPSPSNPGAGCYRYCAALDKDISRPECRTLRGSHLDCPPVCPHCTFGLAAYEKLVRLEASWTTRAARYILQHVGRKRFDDLIGEGALIDEPDVTALESGLIHAIHYGLAFEQGPEGRNLADYWATYDSSALTPDERCLTQCRAKSFVTVVQVLKVIDPQTLLCQDALEKDPSPFLVLDHSTAAHANREARLLSWLTPFRHFRRLGGIAHEIPAELWEPWRQTVMELFEKDKARDPNLAFRAWLSRRVGACADLLDTLTGDQGTPLSVTDYDHRSTPYGLKTAPAEVFAALRSRPDFQPLVPPRSHQESIASFRWVTQTESGLPAARLFHQDGPGEGISLLGHVYLFNDRLVLETFTRSKFALANRLLGEYLGSFTSG